MGLSLVAAIKGYKAIFVMPDKMSQEKVNLLKSDGAEVIITRTDVPPDSPESYNGVADRLAKEIPGAFRPNQFENSNNRLAHYKSLVCYPAKMMYLTLGPKERERRGIKDNLVRLSVGLEDVEDLREDLERALEGI